MRRNNLVVRYSGEGIRYRCIEAYVMDPVYTVGWVTDTMSLNITPLHSQPSGVVYRSLVLKRMDMRYGVQWWVVLTLMQI
jgi:hypothetical protein